MRVQVKFLLAPCRINAAFYLATERGIYAAAKNCVVHPELTDIQRFPASDAAAPVLHPKFGS